MSGYMSSMNKLFIVLVAFLLFFGIVGGEELVETKALADPYSYCISQIGADVTPKDCSNYIAQSASLEKYMNFAYSSEIDDTKYLDCLFYEKKNTFDFSKMQDICLKKNINDNMIKKQLDLFKVNCSTNYNPLDGNLEIDKPFKLEVNCTGVVPSTCYNLDAKFESVDLGFGFDSYRIQPIIIKGESCPNYAVFRYLKKSYDIIPKSKSLIINVDQPIIQTGDGTKLDYSSLIDSGSTEVELSLLSFPEKEYYSCLAKYVLFSKKQDNNVVVLNNGRIENLSYGDLKNKCADKVLYATKINMGQLLKSKEVVKKNMIYALKNVATIDPSSDLEGLIKSLEYYYKIYEKNMKVTSNPQESKIKVILDLDFVLDNYLAKKQQASKEEMNKYDKELVETIETNIFDRLYSKKNREPTIKEFIQEINEVLKDPQYASIKDIVISNYVLSKFESGLALQEDIEIKVTKDYFFIEGVKLSKEFTKLSLNDYNFSLKDGSIVLSHGDFKVQTKLDLSLIDGKELQINSKKIVLLDPAKVSAGNIIEAHIYLVEENNHILYNVEKTAQKKLLGFIPIREVITDIYNAETGVKIGVKKPWWDFLVVG